MSQYKLATHTELSTVLEQCDTFVMSNCSQRNYLNGSLHSQNSAHKIFEAF